MNCTGLSNPLLQLLGSDRSWDTSKFLCEPRTSLSPQLCCAKHPLTLVYISLRLGEPREAVFCYQGTRALSLVVLKGVPCCILPFSLSPRTGRGRDEGELGWEPLLLVWSQWREPALGFLPVLSYSGLAPSLPGRLIFVLTAPRTVQLSLASCPCLDPCVFFSASVRSQFWYLTAVKLPNNLGVAWCGCS